MYENRHINEPKWKSWIVQTTTPLFTPDQCRQIIECGRRQKPQTAQVGMNKPGGGTDTKKRVTTISWIPFKEMGHMYRDLNNFISKRKSFWIWRHTSYRECTIYRVSCRRIL